MAMDVWQQIFSQGRGSITIPELKELKQKLSQNYFTAQWHFGEVLYK